MAPDSKGAPTEVHELSLANVFLSKYEHASSGSDWLELDWQKMSLETRARDGDGQLEQSSTTASFDRALGASPGTDVYDAGSKPALDGLVSSDLQYYLWIDGVPGNSTDKLFGGWFKLADMHFGFDAPASFDDGSESQSRAKLSPLSLEFATDTGMAWLLAEMARGRVIEGASFVGVTKDQNAIDQVHVDLQDVVISGLEEESSGAYRITLGYDAAAWTAKPVTAAGQSGDVTSFGWNLSQAKTTQVVSAFGKETAPAETVAGEGLRYYIRIDGVDGAARVGTESGLIALGSIDFNGADLFKAAPQISVAFGDDLQGPTLMRAVATGDFVDGIVIDGVSLIGDAGLRTIEQHKFDKVLVTRLELLDNGGYVAEFSSTQAGIKFDRVDYFTGAKLGSSAFAFDLATNDVTSFDGIADDLTPIAALGSSRSETSRGYIKFDGIDGESQALGYENWIAFDNLDFKLETLVQAGSGQGSGRATLSPLSIGVLKSALDPVLMQALTAGTVFETAQLHVVNTSRDDVNQVVMDLELGRARTTMLKIGDIEGESRLRLDFDTITLETFGYDDLNKKVSQGLFGWDVVANQEITDHPPMPAQPVDGDGAANAVLENAGPGTAVGITAQARTGGVSCFEIAIGVRIGGNKGNNHRVGTNEEDTISGLGGLTRSKAVAAMTGPLVAARMTC